MKYNKEIIVIFLSGAGRGLRGRDGRGDLTKVQYKPIWNCHNESPLYNKYILIKRKKGSTRKHGISTIVDISIS
jgi:hypothetical protein